MSSGPFLLHPLLLATLAVLSLVPATLRSFQGRSFETGDRFWSVLGLAFVGALFLSVMKLSEGWQSGLAVAIWVSITAILALFALVALREPQARPIGKLLFPSLLIAGAFGALALVAEANPVLEVGLGTLAHVIISVLAYALISLSAVAALAALLKERALKSKSQNGFVNSLPAVHVSEKTQIELLLAAGLCLSVAVISGIFAKWDVGIRLDHKSLLSLVSLGVVTALLFAHFKIGLRGRRAARFALTAFLLLTLAYLGVKFVTDILLA